MTFWRLYTLQVAIAAAALAGYRFGYLGYLLESDVTRISILILLLFISASAFVGRCAVKREKPPHALWFASDAMLSLGMMGTVLGLLMVLTSNFGSVDTADIEAMSLLMAAIGSGMGTALTTTLVGLGASLLLKLELVILEG